MRQFAAGFIHFFNAFGIIGRYRLWHYYLYPVLLSVLLFILSTYAAFSFVSSFTDYLYAHLNIVKPPADDSWWELCKAWLLKAAEIGLALVLKLAVWLLWLKISKYVVLVLLSPVFAFLSERIEYKISGREYPFSFSRLIKDALRGSVLAMRNFFIEISLIALVTCMGWFFPPIAFLASPFLLFVSAYFYGFSMMDYTNERRRLSVRSSIAYIRQNRGLALGIGMAYLIIDSIPLLGLVIAPVNGVTGATAAVLENENQSKNT